MNWQKIPSLPRVVSTLTLLLSTAITGCGSSGGTTYVPDGGDGGGGGESGSEQPGGGGTGKPAGGGGADAGPPTSTGNKRVFVTSTQYTGDLRFNGQDTTGLKGADALCAAAAARGALGGTWVAWVSDQTTNAIDRINDVGPWTLINRQTIVFRNKQAMAAAPLAAIDVDETGKEVFPNTTSDSLVWTGTLPNGVVYEPSTPVYGSCSGWTDDAGYGGAGLLTSDGADWTNYDSSSYYSCLSRYRLYCFEQ